MGLGGAGVVDVCGGVVDVGGGVVGWGGWVGWLGGWVVGPKHKYTLTLNNMKSHW